MKCLLSYEQNRKKRKDESNNTKQSVNCQIYTCLIVSVGNLKDLPESHTKSTGDCRILSEV